MFLTVLKTILIIFEVLLIFNLMIIVHELGHFLAARWRGLVIEKFGIWFGKPIWKKKINGVEYSLGSIPAGGFVALPQLAPMEVMEGKIETPREQLPPISAMDKIIVAFAGPLFSMLLAVAFAVVVWGVGRPVGEAESTQVIGEVAPGSPAAESGLLPGDKIKTIDGHPVTRFGGMGTDSINWRVIRSEGDSIEVVVEREINGEKKEVTLHPKPRVTQKDNWWNRKGLRQIGIGPSLSSIVAAVESDSPAAKAGLQVDDEITAVNGQKILMPDGIYDYASANPDKPITLTVKRGEQELSVPFAPEGVKVLDVTPKSPAEAAGLKKGDVILSMDGQKMPVVAALMNYVASKGGTQISMQVRRGSELLTLQVTPQVPKAIGGEEVQDKKPKIGFMPGEDGSIAFRPMGRYRTVYPTPMEQVRTGFMSIVNTLDAVMSRKSQVSLQHMGGPVMMMNAYYQMLSGPEGLRMALWFSVILNVNLALLNLLPIPVLDGGHITLAVIESVRRKPVNVKVLEFVQSACALMIIGFMVFIAFFDVQDLPFLKQGPPAIEFEAPKK